LILGLSSEAAANTTPEVLRCLKIILSASISILLCDFPNSFLYAMR
jgi:hypothetical protein